MSFYIISKFSCRCFFIFFKFSCRSFSARRSLNYCCLSAYYYSSIDIFWTSTEIKNWLSDLVLTFSCLIFTISQLIWKVKIKTLIRFFLSVEVPLHLLSHNWSDFFIQLTLKQVNQGLFSLFLIYMNNIGTLMVFFVVPSKYDEYLVNSTFNTFKMCLALSRRFCEEVLRLITYGWRRSHNWPFQNIIICRLSILIYYQTLKDFSKQENYSRNKDEIVSKNKRTKALFA